MKKIIFMLIIFFVSVDVTCLAEVNTFHAESSYTMDRCEPIKIAQEKVFKDAIRIISEEACMRIEVLSKANNSKLEQDCVSTLTAAVIRVKSKTFGKEFTDEGDLTITVKVDAELDTNEAAEILNELLEAKNSDKNYDEVLKAYTERKKNFDTVYGEYMGSYQKNIMRKIREASRFQNYNNLDEMLKNYDAAIAESVANNAESSLAYIKRGNIYLSQGKIKFAEEDFKRALELNNDATGVHYAKAFIAEGQGNNVQAVQEYRAFVKDADIVYYDFEIIIALERIVSLEEI